MELKIIHKIKKEKAFDQGRRQAVNVRANNQSLNILYEIALKRNELR